MSVKAIVREVAAVAPEVDTLDGFMTAPQVAEYLGFSLSYVHRLDTRGHLRGLRIGPRFGGMLIFKTDDVEAFKRSWKRRVFKAKA